MESAETLVGPEIVCEAAVNQHRHAGTLVLRMRRLRHDKEILSLRPAMPICFEPVRRVRNRRCCGSPRSIERRWCRVLRWCYAAQLSAARRDNGRRRATRHTDKARGTAHHHLYGSRACTKRPEGRAGFLRNAEFSWRVRRARCHAAMWRRIPPARRRLASQGGTARCRE